jgi:hypothetical protein
MIMLMMLLACLAAWTLVARMLRSAGPALIDALCGVQGGGWMPSAGLAARPASRSASRAFIRA